MVLIQVAPEAKGSSLILLYSCPSALELFEVCCLDSSALVYLRCLNTFFSSMTFANGTCSGFVLIASNKP